MRSKLALTPELVSLVERKVPQDHLPEDPNRTRMTEADYANSVGDALKGHETRPIWVFGYGSLLWNPGFYEKFCPLILSKETCQNGYVFLKPQEKNTRNVDAAITTPAE